MWIFVVLVVIGLQILLYRTLKPKMPRNIVGPLSGPKCVAAAASAHLTYNGGPLLTNVQVSTIYWGSAWANDPLRAQLDAFFEFVVTSSLVDQLAEYSVPGQTIGHGAFVQSTQIASDPGPTVDDTQIAAFVQQLVSDGTVPPQNPSSVYFVFTPSGTTVTLQGSSSCKDFCGYHNSPDGALFYAVVPYADCAGCSVGSTLLDSMTVIASHELCESITDPAVGSGWVDSNTGFEIGDICEGGTKTISRDSVVASVGPTFNVSVSPTSVVVDGSSPVSVTVTLTPSVASPPPPPPPPSTSFVVQTEWSNAQGRCV